jgi:uncharacterized protein
VAPELFVDTSGWFPLADSEDPAHARVSQVLRDRIERGVRVVTTNLVIAETHVLLTRRIHRDVARAFLREVRREPNVVLTSTPEHEETAVRDWIDRYGDQDFSLTDAVSFTFMAERGIREALALDRHFRIAGYTQLPESE